MRRLIDSQLIGFVSTRVRCRTIECFDSSGRVKSALLAEPFVVIADAGVVASDSAAFEPVLNVPAFGAFFFIAIVFGFLQYRIAAIGRAAERRTESLANLRQLKSLEISGKNIDVSEIEKAKEAYRTALEEVERLRTVIPGFARIAPPPSESENRQRMEENVAAAKQFLNIDLQSTLPPVRNDEKDSESKGLSPFLVGVLAVVGLSQVALLFLLAFGPQSSPGGDFF